MAFLDELAGYGDRVRIHPRPSITLDHYMGRRLSRTGERSL